MPADGAALAPAAVPPRSRRRESRSAIWAIGTAVPGTRVPQDELVEFMKRAHRAARAPGDPGGAGEHLARRLDVLYRRSGIRARHSCLADYGRSPEAFTFYPRHWRGAMPSTARRMEVYREAALPLARAATTVALGRVPGFDPALITHLIVTSCTGFYSPGLDVELALDLGLSPNVVRTLVGFQGCHAGVSSLRLADAISCADPQSIVLVVCIELCTLHFQIEPSADNLLANSLFADGAAAALVGAAPGVAGGIDGPAARPAGQPCLAIERGGSWLAAGTREEMVWTIGNRGFQMGLSALVPRLLGHNVAGFLEQALAMAPREITGLDFWAIHPGGPAILDQVERALDIDPALLAPSRAVLRDCGNMSSPTILFVLERIWTGAGSPGRGLALAFGPGLTLEAIVLEWCAG